MGINLVGRISTCSSVCRHFGGTPVFLSTVYILVHAVSAWAQGLCDHPVARVVSAEGQVSITAAEGAAPRAVRPSGDICAGGIVEVGSRSRATVALLGTNQIIRVDQNTTLRIVAVKQDEGGSVIDLTRGLFRLFSPTGRPLDVRTPFVTAGVKGTEFFVSFDDKSGDTKVGVIDGSVQIIKGGTRGPGPAPGVSPLPITLSPGEAALIPQTGSPERIEIRPTDAVRWTIFYPPSMWTLDKAEEDRLDPHVARAWRIWASADRSGFADALDAAATAPPPDARSLARLAALLLSVGREDEAASALARAEADTPGLPMIAALRSIIAVAENRTDDALALSEGAVKAALANPDPAAVSSALVARSYALQAAHRLEDARDALLRASPSGTPDGIGDPLVLARLAEIELSLGNVAAARRAAERAARAPLSRAHSILGFAAMADYDFAAARSAFETAHALEAADPLPEIGMGLSSIRSGDLAAGRSDLAIAVALDPQDAVARSYLGKAEAAAHEATAALRDWSLAEAADPKDPTPSLYRANTERSLNRPDAALTDLERSIALNDNRAPYRSSLLLEQDLATRTSGLAAIYRDLGFEEPALTEGYKSLSVDPANPGAHRFLSDTYLSLPRHETASDSELLQSLLLQPLNVLPLRPRLSREGLGILTLGGPSHLGFNEFSPAFAADGLGLLADGFAGNNDTFGGNVVGYGIERNFSFSAGQFGYRTSGIRQNDRLQRSIQDVLVQPALSDTASVMGEFRHSYFSAGDSTALFDSSNFLPAERQTTDFEQYRLGGRYDAAPGMTVVGVFTHEHQRGAVDTGSGFALNSLTDGDFGEAATYLNATWFNVVAGLGYFYGTDSTIATIFGTASPADLTGIRHRNAWIYANGGPVRAVRLTLGASFDDFRSSIVDRDKINPKLGVSWDVTAGTTLRAAYFQTVKRTTVGGQTIEPTQIAGFNQLFDDANATVARRWGAGLDQKITYRLFAGAEWSQRQLTVPTISLLGPSPVTIEQGWKERFGRVYADWIPAEHFAVNVELQWERLDRDPTASNPDEFADLGLLRIPVELRYFGPTGLLGLLRTSFYREHGTFLDASGALFGGKSSFATVDTAIGWRFPGRGLLAVLEVDNLFDQRFRFQDSDSTNPRVVPRLQVLARITANF